MDKAYQHISGVSTLEAGPRTASPDKHLIAALALTMLATLLGMAGCELGMRLLSPGIATWKPHIVTAIVGSITATAVAHVILRKRHSYKKARNQAARLAAVKRITRAVGTPLHLDDLLETVYQEVMALLPAEAFFIALYDRDADELDFQIQVDKGIRSQPRRHPLGNGLTSLVVTENRPLLIRDYEQEKNQLPRPILWGTNKPSASWLGVPMQTGEQVVGVICVQTYRPRAYAQEEQQLLSTIADQVAIAVENARLFEAERQRAEEIETLTAVTRAVSSSLNLSQVLNTIAAYATDLSHSDEGGIFELNEKTNTLQITASYNASPEFVRAVNETEVTIGSGALGRSLEAKKPIQIADTQTETSYRFREIAAIDNVRSILAVPMLRGEKLLGGIALWRRNPGQFSPRDLDLLTTLSNHAAVAIENARLYEETWRRSLEQEMLREAVMTLTTTVDRNEVIERILAQLQEVVPYDTASVQLLKGSRLELVGGRGFPNLPELLGILFPVDGDNPNSEVIRTKKSFIVEDAPAIYNGFRKKPHAQANIHSWLGVPMLIKERLVGMIALDKHEPGFYTQDHARLAEAFAAQAAIAIENSRLFQAERQQRELTQALEKAAAVVSSSLELDKVLDHILEQVERVVAGDTFNVILIENGNGRVVRWRGYDQLGVPRPSTTEPIPIAQFPNLARIAQAGETLVISDTATDPNWVPLEGRDWLRSYICAPIRIQGSIVGFLNVNGTRPGQFTSAEAERLEAFAAHAATAIENARLYRKLLTYAEELEQRVQQRTAQLQAQYARLEATLHSTTDGIIVTDTSGAILQTNPIAHTWLTQALPSKDAARLREVIRDLALRSAERPSTVLELAGLDLELKAAPVVEAGKERSTTAVVAAHDVTDLKALDRMKSRFVSNVSHELRTPVTTIKLYAALLQRAPPEKWVDYVDALAQEADRQAQLVENILQISRIDTGRLQLTRRPVSLNRLTAETINSHQLLAQESALSLEHHPSEPEPVTLVDEERTRQALNNLVENAIHYTPEGGRVVISTGKKKMGGHLWATVTVEDTGIGIAEEELPHIFERFFRGEQPRTMQIPGTGLGLSIVKEIVELHGGQVTVRSEIGRGTTFALYLPLAEETGEKAHEQ